MPRKEYEDIKQEDIKHKATVESGIRLVKAKIAKIEQLAELKALEDKLSLLAKSNVNDRHVQAASGEAERLVDELRQTLVGISNQEASTTSKRARSTELVPERSTISKRQRYERDLSDFVHSDTARSSANTRKKPSKVQGSGVLREEDFEWLQKHVEKYRGLGSKVDGISWAHLLADRKDLAKRVTAAQCAVAWKDFRRRQPVRQLENSGRLLSKDIQWIHQNIERYRVLGPQRERISWIRMLEDNKDLGKRMSAAACAQAWYAHLQKEKAHTSGKTSSAKVKDTGQGIDDSEDDDIDL